MSRIDCHSYMEGFGGVTLGTSTKDLYLNLTRPIVLSDLLPWGASHIQTNTSVDYIDSVAKTNYTQTEYSYSSSNVPMEITGISLKRSASEGYKTARKVDPFEWGDADLRGLYTDTQRPVYFLRNNKIIVYPQFADVVTDGIKVSMVQRLANLSSTNTTTGMSAEAEKLWALRAMVYYYTSTDDKRTIGMQGQYNEYLWSLKKLTPIAARTKW